MLCRDGELAFGVLLEQQETRPQAVARGRDIPKARTPVEWPNVEAELGKVPASVLRDAISRTSGPAADRRGCRRSCCGRIHHGSR
jgi:hypothetical protein